MEYFNTNNHARIKSQAKDVHVFESKADDLRRNIEQSLYGKALLPQFREDILRIIERIDKLPNKCQSILFMIGLQNLKVDKVLREDFKKLVDVNIKTFDKIFSLISALFQNPKEISECAATLDKIESMSDHIERGLIEKIFNMRKIDKSDKILLKELVLEIGNLTDQGEIIADMVTIVNIKVRV